MATSSAALPQSSASTRRRRRLVPRTRWIVLAVVVAVALGGGWTWFKGSSLVQVQQVKVIGAGGTTGSAVRHALINSAQSMTTLEFDPAALRRAAAPFPAVKSVEVRTAFPHTATIVVHEYVPVATVTMDGGNVPVAADGTLLRGTRVSGVPPLTVAEPVSGTEVTASSLLSQVHVLAGASPAQRGLVQHVDFGAHGVSVQLQGAPIVWFGAGTLAIDKWIALKRVLADPASQGATYIDVRVPSRPAAGGFAGDATGVDPSASTDSSSIAPTP